MQENRFIELLAKKKSKEMSLLELRELSQMIDSNPEFAAFAQSIEELYKTNLFDHNQQFEQKYIDSHWQKFQERIGDSATGNSPQNKSKKIYSILKIAAVAASIILIIGTAFFYNYSDTKINKFSKQLVSTTTNKGSKTKIVLPDSSIVVLNADSKLSYGPDFNVKTRNVQLTGEAFFEVSHNAAMPFVIHTDKADVKVLGTVFNVRYYPEESIFETTLIKGKVEVIPPEKSAKKVILKPMEKYTIAKPEDINTKIFREEIKIPEADLTQVTTIHDSIISETAWTQNHLSFVNKPLVEIAAELERQFNIQVVFKTNQSKSFHYTVYLDNYSLEEALKALKSLKKFDYSLNNNILIID